LGGEYYGLDCFQVRLSSERAVQLLESVRGGEQ
jgi:hypothetical protein